jgi:hypothetical protein
VVNRTRLTVRWLATTSVKRSQIGGTHYKDIAIQPFEYIHKNNIGYLEETAIKYVSRWRTKGGIQDLEKAVHARVSSRTLMAHSYRVIRRMRYGTDSTRERHNDRGGPSSDTT